MHVKSICRRPFKLNNLVRFPLPDPVKVIRSGLHHLSSFWQVRCPVVGPAERIADGVGKLVFNDLRADVEHFVKDGSGHGPEPVPGHFGFGIVP